MFLTIIPREVVMVETFLAEGSPVDKSKAAQNGGAVIKGSTDLWALKARCR